MPVLFSHISLFRKLYWYTQPGMVSDLLSQAALQQGTTSIEQFVTISLQEAYLGPLAS
jgi:hypothetical protein